MAITLTNPEGLLTVDLYRQVAVTTGSRTLYLAGQVPVDAEGTTVGNGDMAAQTEQCYLNVATALAAGGATFADVAKLTLYAVDLSPTTIPAIAEGVARAAAQLGVPIVAPLTGVGVASLADPSYLVEVEAGAVLD